MIDNYILYSNLPSIDLHGMDKVFAIIKVKDFINDNYKLKNEVHKYLKSSDLVVSYKVDLFNDGVTVVELK